MLKYVFKIASLEVIAKYFLVKNESWEIRGRQKMDKGEHCVTPMFKSRIKYVIFLPGYPGWQTVGRHM